MLGTFFGVPLGTCFELDYVLNWFWGITVKPLGILGELTSKLFSICVFQSKAISTSLSTEVFIAVFGAVFGAVFAALSGALFGFRLQAI